MLVCHLARIIQSKAKDVVVTRQHRHGVGEGISENVTISTTTTTISTSTTFFSRNGSISEAAPEGQQGGMKQAQQLLQALLRGTNNHANLLAAAKVPYKHKTLSLSFVFSIMCNKRLTCGSVFFPMSSSSMLCSAMQSSLVHGPPRHF